MNRWILGTLSALWLCAALPTFATDAETSAPKQKPVTIEMGKGHFNRDSKTFHEWDKAKEIPAACTKCHAAEGLPEFVKEGKNTPAKHVKNGFACTNCHTDMLTYERHKVAKTTFPSGVAIDTSDNDTNLCITCHQGRESSASVTKAISDKPMDTPDAKLAFIHVHYFPAGATLYGTQAKVAYEFPGKTYAGRHNHPKKMNQCSSCHDAHSGAVKVEKCVTCHEEKSGRPEDEAQQLDKDMRVLYTAIQDYALAIGGISIAFTPNGYPYWFTDSNGNRKIDPEEFTPANTYKAYTPRLLQAVYNYTFLLRDGGAAYHNPYYAGQIMHDTLESLAASGKTKIDMKGKERP